MVFPWKLIIIKDLIGIGYGSFKMEMQDHVSWEATEELAHRTGSA